MKLVATLPAPSPLPPWVIHCPQCLHPVSGTSDGKAVRALAAHLVSVHHVPKEQKQ